MKSSIHIVLILAAGLLFNSCAKENMGDCFKTASNVVKRERDVSNFNTIRLEDKIDLYITQGNYYKVVIETGQDLQSNIKTDVTDSTLQIKNINKCNFIRDPQATLKVYVTLPRLRMVRNGGVGTIYFENQYVGDSMDVRIGNSGDVHINVNLKYLATSTHGNGDLYATGSVDYSSHYTNGTNFLFLKDLTIKDRISVNSHTIGDCNIKSPQNGIMDLEIWESGNIYYTGNPGKINLNSQGTGQLYKE